MILVLWQVTSKQTFDKYVCPAIDGRDSRDVPHDNSSWNAYVGAFSALTTPCTPCQHSRPDLVNDDLVMMRIMGSSQVVQCSSICLLVLCSQTCAHVLYTRVHSVHTVLLGYAWPHVYKLYRLQRKRAGEDDSYRCGTLVQAERLRKTKGSGTAHPYCRTAGSATTWLTCLSRVRSGQGL